MDDFMLRVFQFEVALQCRFVLLGAAQLDQVQRDEKEAEAKFEETYRDADAKRKAVVWDKDVDWDKDDPWEETAKQRARIREAEEQLKSLQSTNRIWFALQSILVSAANLSKLLWGSDDRRLTQAKRDQRNAERQALRDSLGVTDDSPLKRRAVRNQFEHIDEKLEKRFRDPNKRRGLIGRNIGGRSSDPQPKGMFGHYFPDDGVVVFWDESVNVPEVAEAARNLLPVAESESMRMGGGE